MESILQSKAPEKTRVKQYPVKILLVDDQKIIAESVKRMIEGIDNAEFEFCSDPALAVETAENFAPTIILQDLIMPDIDGMMLVRYFRANPKTRNIPIVVLSSKEDAKVKAEAFAAGANDYMVKFPEKEEVVARIKYHSTGYISLLERNEAFEKLEESQQKLQGELSEAAQYVMSLLPEPLDEEIKTAWRFIPSTELGGDAFGYHWVDEVNFAVYLLDVCGHGVGAALLSISIINLLRSQSLPNADLLKPETVLSALNQAFPMESNNGMFFTMWYGVFNKHTRELKYSSGGHPPALLFSGETLESVELIELKTKGFLVGGEPNETYESAHVYVGEHNNLFLFSDGVYEIRRANGKMMTFPEFEEVVQDSVNYQNEEVDYIVRCAQQCNGQAPFEDDFSLLQLRFDRFDT